MANPACDSPVTARQLSWVCDGSGCYGGAISTGSVDRCNLGQRTPSGEYETKFRSRTHSGRSWYVCQPGVPGHRAAL